MTLRLSGSGRTCTPIVALAVGLWLSGFVAGAAPAMAGEAVCLGDCDGDDAVAIGELVIGINIALRQREVSSCAAFDANRDGGVSVDELIRAVTNALSTCGTEDPIDRGLASLAAGNLIGANDAFVAAANARPADPRANLYLAITRLMTNGFRAPQAMDLLGRAGVAIRGGLEDVCALHATAPALDSLPEGTPRSGEILNSARTILLPALQAALTNLERISPDAVIRFDLRDLPPCLFGQSRAVNVEIDRGDLLAIAALFQGASALLDISTAYDLDFRLQAAATLPPRMVFDSSPDLLTLVSADRLSTARRALRLALSALVDAIDAIQSETDDQSDDLLVILSEDSGEADRVRQAADLIREALGGEVTLPTALGLPEAQRLNLNRLFSASFGSLRGFVPAFDSDSNPDPHRFPDPSFGGTTPDLTQETIDEALSGGPLCAVCQSDDDCAGIGTRHLRCSECFFDCSGEVSRCSRGFTQCEDGAF